MIQTNIKVLSLWCAIYSAAYFSFTTMVDPVAYLGLMFVIPAGVAFAVAVPMVWTTLVIVGGLMFFFGESSYRWIGGGVLAVGLFAAWVEKIQDKQRGGSIDG